MAKSGHSAKYDDKIANIVNLRAQLAEWTPPLTEDMGSSPIINNFIETFCNLNTIIKEKEAKMGYLRSHKAHR